MTLQPQPGLPEIPVIDIGEGGPLALLEAALPRARALLAVGREKYPAAAIRLGDALSRRWLAASAPACLAEVDAIAARLGAPGAHFLNVSYEWACTCGVGPAPRTPDGGDPHDGDPRDGDPHGGASRLLRVLDWSFEGLGAQIVAARGRGDAGPWINLTWPGFVGCIQAMAPGRFAAAFNQAPQRAVAGSFALDWAAARLRVWRSRALPPALLLRRVFESCPDYAAAKAMLTETPIALPAIFTLSGLGPEEGCVIERLEESARVHDIRSHGGPVAVANAWLGAGRADRPRGEDNPERRRLMAGILERGGDGDFAWLRPPILNPTTHLAMVADAASGRLSAVGIEAEKPATRILHVDGEPPAGQPCAADPDNSGTSAESGPSKAAE